MSIKHLSAAASLLAIVANASGQGNQPGKAVTPFQAAVQIKTSKQPLPASPAAQPAPPAADNTEEFAKGRILIEPRAGLSNAGLEGILSAYRGKARKLGQSNLHIVDLPPEVSEQAMVESLAHHPHLKFAELDRRVRTSFVPNDPYYGSQWHIAKVGAGLAWDTTQGSGVIIAILDSGVDKTHPDLAANMVAGYNLYNNNADASDVCGHGTAVAGTAAASTNNGAGVAGIAGRAKIMPLRVAYFDTAKNGCYAYYSTIASGLTYAADHGARVANVSFGGVAASSTIQSAAQYMKNKGGLVFVSAGNSGINENIPPTSTMIAVSATDANDAKTSWSSFGNFTSLSAPGAGIWTTSKGAIYQAWNGTSFSSPLAAGVAALMMSANPALGSGQIENMLFSSAVDLGASGRDPYYGYGRVNAAAAIKAAVASLAPADTQRPTASISAPLAGATVSGLALVNVTAADNVGVARVELSANGTTVAIDSAAPYSFSWNSTGVPNGMATLVARAYDAAGNSAASASVAVNVANAAPPVVADATPPVVVIANPVAGAVSGVVAVTVNASDNSGAAGISQQLYIDGVLRAQGTGATLSYSWDTRLIALGTHTLAALARDRAGNTKLAWVQVSR